MITRSNRISVRHSTDRLDNASSSDSDKLRRKTWQMTLREVTQADAGAYMCQLNIEPMISQVAYLHVTGIELCRYLSYECDITRHTNKTPKENT